VGAVNDGGKIQRISVANFGAEGHSNEDIATVREIPVAFDMLVGGFPCQDYSVAKSAKSATGLEGKKGVLWWEILRLISQHKPKFIFLENVDRLLKSPTGQRGRDFAVMLSTLGEAGYFVEWRVVNAAEYGFPQRRIRVFIVAERVDTAPNNFNPEGWIFREGVLAKSLPIDSNETGIAEIAIASDAAEVSQSFGRGLKVTPFANSGVFIDGKAHTGRTKPKSTRRSQTLRDILVDKSEVPEEYWVDQARIPEWEFLKAAKSIERVNKDSGFSYRYSEGSMAFPDSLDRPSRTILTAEGGSTPSRFKHIIELTNRYRRLTPVELERLSGFPDGWTNPPGLENISDSRRAFFMGNALVVGAIELVGLELAARLKNQQA
jgi:DNA (cytosine-5)-methyltransferase 1